MSNDEGTIQLDVRQFMDFGLHVYDGAGTKVGIVDDFDRVTGYMVVRSNGLRENAIYIPFRTITHIDPREVFVEGSRDELRSRYSSPPPRSTLVERRIDSLTGEDDSRAITSEPNGYDGAPVIVDAAKVGQMAHHIAPGFRVYGAEMEDLGSIKEYNRQAGEMLVEKGAFSKLDMVIPVEFVRMVDREERKVYLAVSSADVQRDSRLVTRRRM